MAPKRDHKLSEFVAFARFVAGVPRFVRRRMTAAEALAIIQDRLLNRERNFLGVVERSVYGNPRSPYRALLDMAGCTMGDLRQLVAGDGLEGALWQLRAKGVYLSFEEFKGLQPIVRGSKTIDASPADFDNPTASRYYSTTTGGSTGPGRRVQLDLQHLEALLPSRILSRQVQGVLDIPAASWSDLPPAGGLSGVLIQAASGGRPTYWCISRKGGPNATPLRFRAATLAALSVARAAGARVQWPRHVPFDRAIELAEWARDQVQREGAATIHSSVSRILRIAIAARENGISLRGVVLRGGGEPPTTAKVAQIVASGATFYSGYAFSEVGSVGSCCLNPSGPNDHHFMRDHLAMVQAPRTVPGFDIEVSAFCFTSLLPSAPKLLLNVESDDYGTVSNRSCGCTWEQLGFPTHVSDIRSFRKLTGEGITLVGTDIERILDELLPARYGGSALDYQFAEEEDERGFTRLILRVAPHVALGDEAAAVDFVLQALDRSGSGGRAVQATWRQAGTVRIRREPPTVGGRGKVQPLDMRSRARAS
jgi:hypothetical protein